MLDAQPLRASVIGTAGRMGASSYGGGGAVFDANAGFDCPVCAVWVRAFFLRLFGALLLLGW
jgi:hypothetical protein